MAQSRSPNRSRSASIASLTSNKSSLGPSLSSSSSGIRPPPSPRVSGISHDRNNSASIADILSTPPQSSKQQVLLGENNSNDTTSKHVDWTTISLSDLTQNANFVCVDDDLSVEAAHDVMLTHNLTSVPIRFHSNNDNISESFDYANLNAYLLVVMGYLEPVDTSAQVKEYVEKARRGEQVPVRFAATLGPREPFIIVAKTDNLLTITEILGSGVHRIAISEKDGKIIGILSQRRLIRYFWKNIRQFASVESLLGRTLEDLKIGSTNVVSITENQSVIAALQKMNEESISSLAVTDSQNSLLGNISVVDVKLLTKSSSAPLLKCTCLQFITHILSGRGVENGQDSYPVFYVSKRSTLAHTIAKLVATNSHRLWIIDPHDPQSPDLDTDLPNTPLGSGKLIGVVSLTDILNLFARSTGKSTVDPLEGRRQRRRSSSSSTRSSISLESYRRSISLDRTPLNPRR